jgi:hypothetical protein
MPQSRGKQCAANARQTRAQNNRPQRFPEGQQQIPRDANNAAAQDNDFRAKPVRERAADDKHPLLRERAQAQDQPDQPAGEQHIVAQEYRQEGNNGVKANVKNKLATQ